MFDKTIKSLSDEGTRPRLLLHACCAPCSSYVTELLDPCVSLTLFFYNPNISPENEFTKRYDELVRYIDLRFKNRIEIICPEWNNNDFLSAVEGLYDIPEGGERCMRCFALRLEETAKAAAERGFSYYCTTLSVSPYKNAYALYKIGTEIGKKYGVKYLPSDFKKKDGYKRSIELSKKFGLYRQNFCGCAFSEAEAEKRRGSKASE